MISTDFAPNEFADDALKSLITLFMPWTWKTGSELKTASATLQKWFPQGKSVFFLSGRSTLSFLLQSLNLPSKSEIIVQGFTCEAVTLPIIYNNFQPVYADIETETFSLDIRDLRKKVTPATKVIILQHSYGIVPKYRNEVLRLAKEQNMIVIEDLAHGFDPGFWRKQNLSANQVLTLSFGRSKALSSVFGGAVITTNETYISALGKIEAKLPYPSICLIIRILFYKPLSVLIKKTYSFLALGKIIHFLADAMGLMTAEISKKEKRGLYDQYLEKKYPNALAKLLIHQMNKYGSMQEIRHNISRVYGHAFNIGKKSGAGFVRFPLLLQDRTRIISVARKQNIYLGNWYSQPVAPVGLNLQHVRYTMGSCPVEEKTCGEIVNLPTLVHTDEADRICTLLK